MPAKKKPVTVNEKVLQRTGEVDDSQLPYLFLDSLIANHHPDLSEANFVVGYHYGWKMEEDGRMELIKVHLFNPFDRQLHGKDVKILLSYNFWHNPITDDNGRQALIDRGLCQVRPRVDKELAIPVRDEFGKVCYKKVDYDIKDFNAVIQRWGIWQIEQEETAKVMAEKWEEEKKRREEKSLEELEADGEGADGCVEEKPFVMPSVGVPAC